MDDITDASGAKWSIRRTSGVDTGKVYQCGTTRAFALRLIDSHSATLPGVIGFYASTIDDAKARLGVK